MIKNQYNTNYSEILTKGFLYKEYVVNNKSSAKIAKEIKCSKITILRKLKKNEISIRTRSEARKYHVYNKYSKILDKKFLYQEYIINKKSMCQIAKEVGCSQPTILNYLKSNNIKHRTISGAKERQNTGKDNPNYIAGVYCKCINFCIDCGKKLNNPIAKRCQSCAHIGELNINWNNGSSFAPYPLGWTKIFKESIRERDNHQCQICGKLEIEQGRKLDVHHIDYDKQNLNPNNLISLCQSCHMETNYNREIYIEYFRILKEIITC